MQEWVQEGQRIASRQGIPPSEKELIAAYLAQMRGDLERSQIPTFTLSGEQRQAIRAKTCEIEGAKDIVVYHASGLISVGMQYEQDRPYFGYVTESESFRNLTFPVYFETAVFVDKNGHAVALPKSNNLLMERQKGMIETDFAKTLAVPGVKAVMHHALFWTQLDIKHQKERGQKLLVGLYARTPDQTFDSIVAHVHVGRVYPGSQLSVSGWDRDFGRDDVWAVPAVVPEAVEI